MRKFLLIFAVMIGSVITLQAQQNTQSIKDAKKVEKNTSTKVKEGKKLNDNAIKTGNIIEDEKGEMVETDKPIMQFDEEIHDFGELEEGPKYDHEFTFENIGNQPLIITGVKASCGCTTPNWPKDPVMPGDKASIKVTYNTKGRLNKFNKAVTITSNAATPTKRLYIKGNVLKATPDTPVKTKSIIENKEEN